MIRGAIFDVDGTLLDSMPIWHTLGEDYLRSLGIEPRENLAETFKTFTLSESARYYQTHYGVTLSEEEIIAGVNRLVENFYRFQAPLRPGAAEFLARLDAQSIPMTIATATDRPLIEAALERCGVRRYFREILTCADVGCGKEQPRIYDRALQTLGTPRAQTWVFEDAFHAARTAHAAGFPVLGIFDPSEKEQSGLQQVSTVYLQDFREADAFWTAALDGASGSQSV